MVVSTTWLATSCGHYTCGATFGNSNCSSSGGGIGGGGGNNNAQQALRYAMDSSAGGLGLEGLNINSSGTFAPVPGFVSPSLPIAPVGIGGMVIVNKKFLYLAFSNGELDAFSIDPSNGNLTAIGTSPYTTLGGSSLVADPLNRFLFVGDPSGISVFTINADGSLPTTALSHTATTEPSEMVTDGTGKYLYAIDGTNINAFAYNQSTGGLTSLGSFAVGMGMANISGETTGKFILGVTGLTGGSGTTDAHIYVFAITQSGTTAGALTQVVSSPFATVNPPSQVIVSPNGKFVYAFTETVNVTATFDPIEGYSIDTNGNLTALSGSPFTSLAGEVGMFDQSGQYLFMAGTDQSTSITSSIALNASSTTGALASNLAHAGLVSVHFVVTDEP
jgi:6-phosphogluconolactonase (cycloisomerase 2 family)